jgi:hypothetical protein
LVVADGRFLSAEATLRIRVTPVIAPPSVVVEVPEKAALGFGTVIRTTFTDDDADESEAGNDWGDGRSATTGTIVHDEGQDPRIEGVVVAAPAMPGAEGKSFAEHTWEAPGLYTVTACVQDAGGLEGCDSAPVTVEPLVVLGIGARVYDAPLEEDEVTRPEVADDADFTYELMVVNPRPSVGDGLVAEAVQLEAQLPAELDIAGISVTRGQCDRDGLSLSCALGDLEPEAEVTLTIRARGPGGLIYDEDRDITGSVSTTSPALEPQAEFLASATLLADATDTDADGMPDVFEVAYALDPQVDDAAADPDGDGLDNLGEFLAGTSPTEPDTDGDGLSDFDEDAGGVTDPTDADTDDDGMPDGWELAHGLDPANDADAGDDPDGDGRTNGEEYAQDGDPQRDDVPRTVGAAHSRRARSSRMRRNTWAGSTFGRHMWVPAAAVTIHV